MKKHLFLFFLVLMGLANADGARPQLADVLEGYVQDGRVDYEGLRQNRMEEMDRFVEALATADLDVMEHDEKVAFLLDAYNGLVVYQIVTEQDAPDSARKRARFFRGRRYTVAGESKTLDNIEHDALRPLAEDPRVHFVLVCGANSCPQLKASSFLAARDLDKTLDEAAREYINNPQNVAIDKTRRTVVLNKIFDWYADDFGDVLKFVSGYLPHSQQQLLKSGKWKIDYRDYDWSLNRTEE